jgi:NADPH:quinone reductase-like Zn-dependent oxidoreductase
MSAGELRAAWREVWHVQTRAALLRQVPGEWEVCDVELDEPREHEVLVRMSAAGLCHSDDHFATGDIPVGHLPFCGGNESADVIEAASAACWCSAKGNGAARRGDAAHGGRGCPPSCADQLGRVPITRLGRVPITR